MASVEPIGGEIPGQTTRGSGYDVFWGRVRSRFPEGEPVRVCEAGEHHCSREAGGIMGGIAGGEGEGHVGSL